MDRSEAKQLYKQGERPMGVYRIWNKALDKSYVGFAIDVRSRINRHKAELKFVGHRNAALLGEWKSYGETAFDFEVLDELARDDESQADPQEELTLLAQMWMERIARAGGVVVAI